MTPSDVKIVQQSFAQVAPIADKAAELFYDRVFETAPAVKPLFHGDMAEQRRKLMATLAVVVNGLTIFRASFRRRAHWRNAMSSTA
jgi:nitric oxide dioxygenase